jgi:hypothetical protein
MGGSPEAVQEAVPEAVDVALHEVVQERHRPLEEGDPRQQRRKDRKECVRRRLREKSSSDPNLAVVDIVPCPTHPAEGPVDGPTDPLECNRAMLSARFAMFLHFVRNSQILHNRLHPREWGLFDE